MYRDVLIRLPGYLCMFFEIMSQYYVFTGRIISRRKQQLLVNKERDLLEAMEPAPISKGTEKIAKNSEIVR